MTVSLHTTRSEPANPGAPSSRSGCHLGHRGAGERRGARRGRPRGPGRGVERGPAPSAAPPQGYLTRCLSTDAWGFHGDGKQGSTAGSTWARTLQAPNVTLSSRVIMQVRGAGRQRGTAGGESPALEGERCALWSRTQGVGQPDSAWEQRGLSVCHPAPLRSRCREQTRQDFIRERAPLKRTREQERLERPQTSRRAPSSRGEEGRVGRAPSAVVQSTEGSTEPAGTLKPESTGRLGSHHTRSPEGSCGLGTGAHVDTQRSCRPGSPLLSEEEVGRRGWVQKEVWLRMTVEQRFLCSPIQSWGQPGTPAGPLGSSRSREHFLAGGRVLEWK